MLRLRGVVFLGLTAAATFGMSPALALTEIGVTSAVLPNAAGTPPGGETRVLQIGLDVVADERVTTGEKGKLQLLFRDGSALTLGPNSDVTVDKFIYNPDTKTGELVMSATKGLFRLVGGRISKTKPIQLKTPTALIGIRGGIMTARVGEQRASSTFHFGDSMTMEAGGSRVSVTRPGFQVSAASGQPPSAPQPVSDEAMSEDLNGFESDEDQADEAGVDVADEDVAGTQLANLGSNLAPELGGGGGAGTEAALLEGGEEANDQVITASQQEVLDTQSGGVTITGFTGRGKRGVSTVLGTLDSTAGQNLALSSINVSGGRFVSSTSFGSYDLQFPVATGESTLTGINSTPFGNVSGNVFLSSDREFVVYELSGSQQLVFAGVPTPSSSFPTSGVTTYNIRDDFTLGGAKVPFIPASLGGSLQPGSQAQAQIYWGTPSSGTYPVLFSGTVVFSGMGASQKHAASLIVGRLPTDENGRRFFTGAVRGVALPTATSPFYFVDGTVATSDAGTGDDFFGSSGPNYAVLEGADVNSSTDAIIERGVDISVSGSEFTIHPNAPLIGTSTKSGIGDLRSTQTLNLYTGGISEDFSSGGTFLGANMFVTTNTTSTTTVNSVTVPFNRIRTVPGQNAIESGIFIDSSLSGGIQNTVFTLGSVSNGRTSAFIDNGHYGAIEDSSFQDAGLVRNIHIDLSPITPSGVSSCTCSFVQWGFWGGQRSATTRHDIGLTPWVAAERLGSAFYHNGASGTFNGEVLATVADGSFTSSSTPIYTARGSYSMNVSIGSGSLSVTGGSISVDGASMTFSGSGTLSGTATEFSGSISGTRGGNPLSGSIVGAFAGQPANTSSLPQNSFGHFYASYGGASPMYQISGVHKSQLSP